MNVEDYIQQNSLKPVTQENFNRFYIHNQDDMNSYFPEWKEGKYFYDIKDLREGIVIDVIYEVVDLSDKKFIGKMKYMMQEMLSADDVEIIAHDGEDKFLLRFWWD